MMRKRKSLRSAPLTREPVEETGFRETALLFVPDGDAASLRRLGSSLYLHHVEHSAGIARYRGSITKAELRAAMKDLRNTAYFLAGVAQVVHGSYCSPSDTELGFFADKLALQVARIARRIEERIIPRGPERAQAGVNR